MNFLRNLLASIIGFFIALFLLFLIFMMIGFIMSGSDTVTVKSKSVLELNLSTPVKDYAPKNDDPIADVLGLNEEKLALNKIINAIDNAKTDDKIKGISIKTLYVNAGIAQTQAIRHKLEEFKESGKFIYAYGDVYDQKSYYLSSVADSLFLNPVGMIEFKGLSTEVLYFKDFEDKYGLKMEVVRHGKYKSAVEPYLSNKMSEANKEQTASFLNSIWSEILEDISKSRQLPVDKLNQIADSLGGRNPRAAVANHLVDNFIYEDVYNNMLEDKAGSDNTISIEDYIASGKGKISASAKDKIAVIYAQGQIMYGEGSEDIIGQELINKAVKKAADDNNVKAIVLRVNSPGGSALASELIWRQLELAKEEKPLVVSMGNLAASGGYYISCGADKIFAEPTTITGSIGVFGMLPNAYEFANDIGINAEQVSTNKSANYSLFEPMSKQFYDVTEEGVEEVYSTFVDRVSKGRKMTFEQADAIAQGRVWTGKEALANGLVDELGGLEEAIKSAAELANIESYKIRNYPNYNKDLKESLSFSLIKLQKEKVIKESLGDDNYKLYKSIHQLQNLKGIQARLPYAIDIK